MQQLSECLCILRGGAFLIVVEIHEYGAALAPPFANVPRPDA
jgi:hypothetical protein